MDIRKLLEELKRQLPESPAVDEALEVLEGHVGGEEVAAEPIDEFGEPAGGRAGDLKDVLEIEAGEEEEESADVSAEDAGPNAVDDEDVPFDMMVPPKKAKKKLRRRDGEEVAAEPEEVTGGY